jgi:hypothetical protein
MSTIDLVAIDTMSILTLLTIATHFTGNLDSVIDNLTTDLKIRARLKIVLSVVNKQRTVFCVETDSSAQKMIAQLDIKIITDQVFVLIVLCLRHFIQDFMVDILDKVSENYSEGDYLESCSRSKEVIDDFKKIERYLKRNGKWGIVEQFERVPIEKKN